MNMFMSIDYEQTETDDCVNKYKICSTYVYDKDIFV